MKKIVPICAAVAAAAMMLSISTPAMAMGGPSGPHVTYPVQGNIGEVIVNPYKVAPLTAVIRDAGYDLSDVTVRIVPKTNGQEITYKVSRTELKTHAGIPVFGLYPDWQNTVVVFYSTAGLLGPSAGPNVKEEPAHPYLTEYRWGETKPAVELKINSVMGYQAFPISVEQAFTH